MKGSFYGARGLTLVSGAGCRVRDDAGRDYLDCTSMYGTVLLGHAAPRVTAAIAGQAATLAACYASFANPRRDALLARLGALVPWAVDAFLCNSGTEAVEAALKAARLTTGRARTVALVNAFHGRTLGALSATWKPEYRDAFQPLAGETAHVAANDLEALDAALTEEVAAFVYEPVQGEGGVRPLDADFLRTARAWCSERGILMIADEVQAGCGRTGRFLASERVDVEADVACLAKGIANGLPLGAALFGPRVAEWKQGQHGSTFGGNPLACAAGEAVLAQLVDDELMPRAERLGEVWREAFRARALPQVREVRGAGLMTGIELRGRAAAAVKAAQDGGLLVLPAGINVVRLLPPLTITAAELDEAAALLAAAILQGAAETPAPPTA